MGSEIVLRDMIGARCSRRASVDMRGFHIGGGRWMLVPLDDGELEGWESALGEGVFGGELSQKDDPTPPDGSVGPKERRLTAE